MGLWRGTALSGPKTIELYESDYPNDGYQLGNSNAGSEGTFMCAYSAGSTGFDAGSDRILLFGLDAEDESGVVPYTPASSYKGDLNFLGADSCSGYFIFRVKTNGTGARLNVIWTGTTSLGEEYSLEVTLTRLPQPTQNPVTIP